jgi:hypothetical protein
MDRNSPNIGTDQAIHSAIRVKAAQLAGSYGFAADECADLQQDLWLDCVVRHRRFDPALSTEGTFVKFVINNRIASLIATRQAGCRDHRRCRHSLDDFSGKEGTARIGDGIAADERDFWTEGAKLPWPEHLELRIDVDSAIRLLPPDLAMIARMIGSSSIVEISRHLAIPRATLYRRIAAIREIFASVGLDRYVRKIRNGTNGRRTDSISRHPGPTDSRPSPTSPSVKFSLRNRPNENDKRFPRGAHTERSRNL